MKLITIHGFNPFIMREVILTLDTIIIVGIRDAFSIERIFSDAHNQEHQGQNDQRDGAHGEQNECQNGKAGFARPMRVCKRLVAKRLNALAHRFEYGHHGGECTPLLRNARKCMGGAL